MLEIKNVSDEYLKIETLKDLLKNSDIVLEVNILNIDRIEKHFKNLDDSKIFYIRKENEVFGLIYDNNQFKLI